MENLTSQKELAVSIIQANPIDVVERIGKYQFIYDYELGGLEIYCIKAPCGSGNDSVKFSKGDIVNVIGFKNGYAIIENVNYKQPSQLEKIASFISLKNQQEFTIPKDYLQKVDDSTAVTVQTGVNFGANSKPQPIYKSLPFKAIPQLNFDEVLEENATFVLNKDFQYVSGYGSSYCSPSGICTADMSPKYSILKAGTKVIGRLFRKPNKIAYKLQAGVIVPPNYNDYLTVKGYGDKGSIDIPIEYLTKEAINNINNNNGSVVSVLNNNKNLLMIVGAFLVGYVLFGKEKKSVKN